MSDGGKIHYRGLGGYESTAYVEVEGDYAEGQDKYTEEHVRAYWSDAEEAWLEVPAHVASPSIQK
jgi:hypothetical protein